MINVAAAIIYDNTDRVLICQRPEGKNCAMLWEFPGGKTEGGETPEECLVRECMEELNIRINIVRFFDEIRHEAAGRIINITFFECKAVNGAVIKKEHRDIRWVDIAELGKYEFCPADRIIAERIMKHEN